MHSLNGRWLSCLLCGLGVAALSGCAGPSALVLKQREANELAYQNARLQESLGERLDELDRASRQRAREETAREELEASRAELETSLRFANEQVKSLTARGGELTKQLDEARASSRQFEDSLRRVQEVASASAGELTELRLRSSELTQRVASLTERNRELAQASSTTTAELEKVQGELVRQRAVVRSFREGKEVQAVSAEALRVQERLQLENADLRGEKVALEKRIEQLETKAAETREAAVATAVATEGPFYQHDSEGLFAEVGQLFKARFEAAQQGQVVWDVFDVTVCGAAGVLILAVLFFLIRTIRIGRLKREVCNLRMAVTELEEGAERDAPRPVVHRPKADVSVASRASRRPARRPFGAVLSASSVAASETEAAPVETSAASADDPFDRLTVEADEGAEDKAPRRVIGAGVWQAPAKAAVDPTPTRVAPTVEVESEDEEDSMANTQIMPSFTEVELQGAASDASDEEDKEILTELKSVINKKFDELLK